MGYAAQVAQSVTRYVPADRAALREFQRVHFGAASRQCDDRVFTWLFERNPYRAADAPPLWLCKRDGAIVGQQAAIPVALKIGDRETRAAWGIDLMIDPRWRLKGVGPALAAAFERYSDICLGLGLSDGARRSYVRSGWSDLGRLPLFARPLHPHAFGGDGSLHRLARRVPRSLFSASAAAAAGFSRAFRGATLEPVPRFDERADAIYALSSPDYPVLVRRDLQALRWRFDEAPSSTLYERYYLEQNGRTLAYAVLRMESYRGQPIARLIDFLSPARHFPALASLLIEEAVRLRAVALFFEHLPRRWSGALRALGCWHVGDSTQFILRAQGDSASDSAVREAGNWLVTFGDSDCDHLPRDATEDDSSAASHPQMVTPAPDHPSA